MACTPEPPGPPAVLTILCRQAGAALQRRWAARQGMRGSRGWGMLRGEGTAPERILSLRLQASSRATPSLVGGSRRPLEKEHQAPKFYISPPPPLHLTEGSPWRTESIWEWGIAGGPACAGQRAKPFASLGLGEKCQVRSRHSTSNGSCLLS